VNLNERERKIAMVVVAALVAMLLYYFVYEPYASARADLLSGISDVQDKLDHATSVFSRQRRLAKVWTELQAGGLNVDPARAGHQTLAALDTWAKNSGFTLVTYKPDRTTQEGTFDVVSLSASGTGQMPQVARMLADIETAGIPLRVNDLTITPQKEGTDELQVRFGLSALCQPPADSTAKPGASGSTDGAKSS
jgi:hypothetical protein